MNDEEQRSNGKEVKIAMWGFIALSITSASATGFYLEKTGMVGVGGAWNRYWFFISVQRI